MIGPRWSDQGRNLQKPWKICVRESMLSGKFECGQMLFVVCKLKFSGVWETNQDLDAGLEGVWDVVIIDRVAVIAINWRLHFITLVTFFSVSICDINEVALRFQVFIQLDICHNRLLLRTIFNSTALYLFLLQELFDYFINPFNFLGSIVLQHGHVWLWLNPFQPCKCFLQKRWLHSTHSVAS